jgi:hypothetical protein
MLLLIIKLTALFEGMLDYFVDASVEVSRLPDGQWNVFAWSEPTAKGWAVLADFATIMHYHHDFMAQMRALMPLGIGTWN